MIFLNSTNLKCRITSAVIRSNTPLSMRLILFRNWTEYEGGFGNVSSEGDFWFGLGKMRHITNSINHMLRVELHDEQGAMSYADYNKFK